MIPFTRPTLGDDDYAAVDAVLKSGWLASGPQVQRLESALAEFIGGGVEVLMFNSGTSALEAALLASDVGPGDEVIVPAMSFVATANVVLRVGARPVFVDVDLHSRNLDAAAVSAALSPKTRAIIPVHFAGLPVAMTPLYELAQAERLVVIEDAAQAIGSQYQGQQIGSSGNPVCFSFHPNKNMTTIEGGALASSDKSLIERLKRVRFHGIERDAQGLISVPEWGGKMNMPDVGAALGLTQLQQLTTFNQRRRALAQRYLEQLPQHDALLLPRDDPGHSWHMFCVCLDFKRLHMTRAEVSEFFTQRGIGLGMHYPAMHLFPLYRRFGYQPGDFPQAEQIGEQTFTLPLFPTLSDRNQDRVCQAFDEFLTLE